MFTIEQLLDGMQISRSAFADIFHRAQTVDVLQRVDFEVIGRSANDREAFDAALKYAENNGFLDTIKEDLFNGSFLSNALVEEWLKQNAAQQPSSQLQAIVNGAAGFRHGFLEYRGTLRAMQAALDILVDEEFSGSGVLLGPQLALTAWHVVRDLFNNPTGNGWRLIKPAPSNLKIRLDRRINFDYRGAMRAADPTTVLTHADWLIAFSSCHLEELSDRLPPNLNELDGCWDYVIIKLAEAVDRNGIVFDRRAAVPRENEEITLVQYPAGQNQRFSHGTVVHPSSLGPELANYRFLHSCNAARGSSGGPCFNKEFVLFGIHQGAYLDATGRPIANRGIPISRIIQHYQLAIGDLPDSDLDVRRIASMGRDGQPVVGCDEFQGLVWKSALVGDPSILIISGDQDGAGKTFHVRVLEEILPNENHLKISLPANSLATLGAKDLAAKICREAGGRLGTLAPRSAPNSSEAVWMRDDVLPPLVDRLEELRNTRLVWLLITDLDQHRLTNSQGAEFLYMIYQQVEFLPWLRVVLDGMQGTVDRKLSENTKRYWVTEIRLEDVVTCLRRQLSELEIVVADIHLQVAGRRLKRRYDEALAKDPSTALSVLQDEIALEVGDYLAVA